MKFYNAYEVPVDTGLTFNPEEDMTEQYHKDDCDINNIINRYVRTGVLGDPMAMPTVQAFYGDYSEAPDYHTAMNFLVEAQAAFESLPSKVRKEFDNDPGKLLEFIGKEENRDEAIRLGLIQRPANPDNGTPNSATSSTTSSAGD